MRDEGRKVGGWHAAVKSSTFSGQLPFVPPLRGDVVDDDRLAKLRQWVMSDPVPRVRAGNEDHAAIAYAVFIRDIATSQTKLDQHYAGVTTRLEKTRKAISKL